MERKLSAILGVSVDNLTKQEAVDRIMGMIADFQTDRLPRYVATVNTDFLVNAHGWLTGTIRNPELLRILRRAPLLTADGMPILWAAKLMGSSFPERVTGVDLIPALAASLAAQGKSFFFLGGDETTSKKAAEILKQRFPGLRIAGIACPFVEVSGANLEDASERDRLILEQIHETSPDVLLINLGNPKQEIWFERVRHQLKVPVSIGVGGALGMIAGSVKRAPDWVQKSGLEWLYRLTQEPKRLWKRYFLDFFKGAFIFLPLIIYNAINRALARSPKLKESTSMLFLSSHHNFALVQLPSIVNEETCAGVKDAFTEACAHDRAIFDFSKVEHISPEGVSLLLKTWQYAQNIQKEVFGLSLSGDLCYLLKLHRAWDVIGPRILNTPGDIVERFMTLGSKGLLYDAVQQDESYVTIHFFGAMDNAIDYDYMFAKYQPIINQRNCVIDLSYCTLIDNTGFQFLLHFRKHLQKQLRELQLRGVSSNLKKQFELAALAPLFIFKN